MANLLQTGSDWLEEQRHSHLTLSVTYGRGSDSVTLDATIGRTVFESINDYGVIEKTVSRDYLIRASDLILDSVLTLPQRGDQVDEVDGSSTYVYEVMAPGREPVYRYSDPYRKTIRIHTKHVDTE